MLPEHIYIQELPYSCGPCAILNVLRLKGETSESEESLTRICEAKLGVGTSNEAMVVACSQVGLEVVETEEGASLDDIRRHLDQGACVIINYLNAFSGNGHYTSIVDYDKRAFYMVDSAFGALRFSNENLSKYWHNGDKTILRWYVAVR